MESLTYSQNMVQRFFEEKLNMPSRCGQGGTLEAHGKPDL